VEAHRGPSDRLLDVGGYDGALALFLDDLEIHLLDPDTTGGLATAISDDDGSYRFVAAVDVLEHIEPEQRQQALKEIARVSSKHVVLNYPCEASKAAQVLMLKLTDNSLIRQHVEWPLPDSNWVMAELEELGFTCELTPHANAGLWVGQYLVHNLMPEAGSELNKYLIEHHANESFNVPLYHLVTAVKKNISSKGAKNRTSPGV